MKFVNVQAYESEDVDGVVQGLKVLYDDEEGRGKRILAFGEFTPDDYQWKSVDLYNGFDEVIPDEDEWHLAHFWCMFKKKKVD